MTEKSRQLPTNFLSGGALLRQGPVVQFQQPPQHPPRRTQLHLLLALIRQNNAHALRPEDVEHQPLYSVTKCVYIARKLGKMRRIGPGIGHRSGLGIVRQ